MFLDVVAEYNGNAVLVELRAARATDHLKNISDGVVHVASLFAIKEFRPFKDNTFEIYSTSMIRVCNRR